MKAYDDSFLKYLIQAEEDARKAADSSLSKKISTEEQSRKDGDAALQDAIDNIDIPDVDLSAYAKTAAMQAGDAATLEAANTFTTDSIADIEIPDV